MTLQKRIEKKGYKVTHYMSGKGVEASKGQHTYVAKNITQLFKKLFK